MTARPVQISASLLNADFARLGEEVRRAVDGGVDSIHLDVMDGHFVDNLTMGPVVVEAVRSVASVPYHAHLMISQPLRHARAFADAGSDLIVAHVEADDDPAAVIEAIDLLLVMTVHPGRGGQAFLFDVLPKLTQLRDEIDRRGLSLPIGVDGGVNLETIGAAHAAGGEVMVAGSALYREDGDLAPTVQAFRSAAAAVTA